MKFKIAAIQMTSGNNKEANLKKAESFLKEGVDQGAMLLALPENFSFMGNEREKLKEAEEIDCGHSVDFLKEFASRHKVWIAGGTIPLKGRGNKVYNSLLLVSDKGDVVARYDKIHLFDVDIKGGESHRESDLVERGRETVAVDTPFGKLGFSVCYDLRFPELYRKLTMDGAKMIFVPAAFTVKTGKAHWEVLLKARAIENQIYIVASAQVGRHNKDQQTYGHSMIIDPWGEVVALREEGEGVITAEIDSSFQHEVRKSVPCLEHVVLK